MTIQLTKQCKNTRPVYGFLIEVPQQTPGGLQVAGNGHRPQMGIQMQQVGSSAHELRMMSWSPEDNANIMYCVWCALEATQAEWQALFNDEPAVVVPTPIRGTDNG